MNHYFFLLNDFKSCLPEHMGADFYAWCPRRNLRTIYVVIHIVIHVVNFAWFPLYPAKNNFVY